MVNPQPEYLFLCLHNYLQYVLLYLPTYLFTYLLYSLLTTKVMKVPLHHHAPTRPLSHITTLSLRLTS